jgi:hypothetical protein
MLIPNASRVLGLAVALLLASVSCTAAASKIPISHNGFYQGNIVEGKAFGIAIGDEPQRLRIALTHGGFYYIGDVQCDYCLSQLIDCKKNGADSMELYSLKHFLRHGNLYVIYRQGRAVEIVWSFDLLPYFDF